MTFIVDKILSAFVFPLGFAIAVAMTIVILDWFGWRKLSHLAVLALLLALWVAATPLFASLALRSLEHEFPVRAVEDTQSADVAIVLGGGVRSPNAGNPFPDFGESSDRIMHAARLLRAGKISKILLTGGDVAALSNGNSEASAMNQVLQVLGVKQEAILTEPRSRNTYENALYSKPIWDRQGFTSGLLVTSALHMPRAHKVFAAIQLKLIPVAIDARAGAFAAVPWPLKVLPDVHALEATTAVVKEWIGIFVYQLRGWA